MTAHTHYELAAILIEAEYREQLAPLTKAEDVLAFTFKAASNQYMVTGDQDRFKGGIGAAMLHLKRGAEYDRILKSVQSLAKISSMLSALQNGLCVDIEKLLEEQRQESADGFEPIAMTRMWLEAKESTK